MFGIRPANRTQLGHRHDYRPHNWHSLHSIATTAACTWSQYSTRFSTLLPARSYGWHPATLRLIIAMVTHTHHCRSNTGWSTMVAYSNGEISGSSSSSREMTRALHSSV
eukprot:scpid88906/ scgid22557/ 